MKTQTVTQLTAYERALIGVVRKLPPERVPEVVDFARFIHWQAARDQQAETLDEDETEEEILASEAEWERLFAKPEAQRLMLEMADEALAEEDAGFTVEMAFDENGDLLEPK